MINVNNSVLNTPGFRAAGWSSASANPNAQSASSLKRTYSPPIPTTAAVSSEYYRLATRDANGARDDALGLDDGEDEEGGMVTGKSNMDVTGRRHHGRGGKKKGRRERQQQETQRPAEPEDDDSSDLSDDSDDDENNVHRWVNHCI